MKKGWRSPSFLLFGNILSYWLHYVHFSALEADCAVGGSKEGVVSSYADVGSREEFRPALSDDNGTGGDLLAGKAFDASVLSVAVSSVS